MERVIKFKLNKNVMVLLGLLVSCSSFAGTLLARGPSAEGVLREEESYPESRFGQQPKAPELGVGRGYASRAVTEMEARDEDLDGAFGGERNPAGLETKPKGPADLELAARNPPRTVPAPSAPWAVEGTSARQGVQEIALIAGDLGYFPKTLFVSRDVPVRLFVTGASKNTLCIMMDSFQVRKQVRSQKIEEITFTPTLPGKYRFYCPVNGMEGTLIVKEFSSAILSN